MSATLQEIVEDAMAAIGEITGPATQTYSEDRMMKDAIRSFNTLHKKYYWDQYLEYFDVVLDETTGKITTDAFVNVLNFEDFVAIWRDGEQKPLPVLPKRYNPHNMTGSRVMGWASLPVANASYWGKKLQFYPITSEANLVVLARVYPHNIRTTQWDWDDRMELDRDMLVYGTAFFSLAGDDLNAAFADVAKNMMEARYRDIMANLARRPTGFGTGGDYPTEWR